MTMTLKVVTKHVIELSDWDRLVSETYGRAYSLQQQDDCKERQMVPIIVPYKYAKDYENDTVPEKVNGREMGVSFAAWLARDPNQKISDETEDWALNMWWDRNFYPHLDMVVNDLYKKKLLKAGEYLINIDW